MKFRRVSVVLAFVAVATGSPLAQGAPFARAVSAPAPLCEGYVSRMLSARDFLARGDNRSAVAQLRLAQDALRACDRRRKNQTKSTALAFCERATVY